MRNFSQKFREFLQNFWRNSSQKNGNRPPMKGEPQKLGWGEGLGRDHPSKIWGDPSKIGKPPPKNVENPKIRRWKSRDPPPKKWGNPQKSPPPPQIGDPPQGPGHPQKYQGPPINLGTPPHKKVVGSSLGIFGDPPNSCRNWKSPKFFRGGS